MTHNLIATIAILTTAILWGTTGVVASFSINLSPFAIGAFAMGVGGLLQALLAAKEIRHQIARLKQHPYLLFFGTLAIVIYPLAFYSSMFYSGVTIGTVISLGTAPIFSALLERFLNKKQLSIKWCISFLLGVLGMILLSMSESQVGETAISAADKLKGIGYGLMAGLTYSLYSWVAKQLIAHDIHSKAAMGSIFGLAALFLLPLLLIVGDNLLIPVNVQVVLYMAIVPMFIGYVLFGYGLRYVDSSKALTLTLFEPVVAALLAMIIVGESINLQGWIGIILILLSLLFLSLNIKRAS